MVKTVGHVQKIALAKRVNRALKEAVSLPLFDVVMVFAMVLNDVTRA